MIKKVIYIFILFLLILSMISYKEILNSKDFKNLSYRYTKYIEYKKENKKRELIKYISNKNNNIIKNNENLKNKTFDKRFKKWKIDYNFSFPNSNDFKKLDGSKYKDRKYNKMNIIVKLPYIPYYNTIRYNHTFKENKKMLEELNQNIIKLYEEKGINFNFFFYITKDDLNDYFKGNKSKLINKFKNTHNNIDIPILISNYDFGDLLIIFPTMQNSDEIGNYMCDESYSEKYVDKLIQLHNNELYFNDKTGVGERKYDFKLDKKNFPDKILWMEKGLSEEAKKIQGNR